MKALVKATGESTGMTNESTGERNSSIMTNERNSYIRKE